MSKVVKREGEDLESLLRRFKRKVNDDMILADIKKHEFYLSPAQKKRKKREEAAQKRRKFERMQKRFAPTNNYNEKPYVKKSGTSLEGGDNVQQ